MSRAAARKNTVNVGEVEVFLQLSGILFFVFFLKILVLLSSEP